MSDLPSWLASIVAVIMPIFGQTPEQVYNGYIEGDYVYVAPLSAGRIVSIEVAEGEQIVVGQLLMRLDDTTERAALRGAEARVAVAAANLDNLKTGRREDEIEVIRASLTRAKADQQLAKTVLDRSSQLLERNLVPLAQLDAQQAALDSADALVLQLIAELRVAELPARDAQQLAAEATLTASKADADLARSSLDNRIILSPTNGLVERVFFDAGEVAATAAPAIAILPPGKLKALFFVPEPERAEFSIGDVLYMTCDGCADDLTVRVTRMASDPQHTPPIIYSREERSRLVFRAEAILQGASNLLPGQPVTLTRQP
ncbi:MAG: HlyD family secretion protein [Paracoccaceae bacterium]